MFAALAISRWIEHCTGWSIKKFIRTARRYCTIEIRVGAHTDTAADPYPPIFATHWKHSTKPRAKVLAWLKIVDLSPVGSC